MPKLEPKMSKRCGSCDAPPEIAMVVGMNHEAIESLGLMVRVDSRIRLSIAMVSPICGSEKGLSLEGTVYLKELAQLP